MPLAAAALADGAALVRWRAACTLGVLCMHAHIAHIHMHITYAHVHAHAHVHMQMHMPTHMHAHTQVRWRAARILGELGEGSATLAALKQAVDTHAHGKPYVRTCG